MRKVEWMDKRGTSHMAEQCQENPGHLPCPRKPLRAAPASPQWVFAHTLGCPSFTSSISCHWAHAGIP